MMNAAVPGPKWNAKWRRRPSALLLRTMGGLLVIVVLAVVLASYFRPGFLIDISVFSQLCS